MAASTVTAESEAIAPVRASAWPRVSIGVALAFVALVAFYAANSGKSIDYGYKHDFLNFYTGGSFALHGQFHELYNLDAQKTLQHQIQPENPVFTWFMRPPFGALLFAPFAALPFDRAFAVFLASQYVALAGFMLWAYRRFGQHALLWCAASPVAMFAIGEGQDSVMILLLALGSLVLLERKRDFASGFLAGLMLIKFHLFLLVPVAILARKRRRMFGGYSAAAALQAAVALVTLGGIGGVLDYVTFLRNMQKADPHPAQQISLFGMALNFHFGIAGIAVGILAVVAAVLYVSRKGSDWQWFAAAIAGSLAVPPHVWEYDATTLMLPAMFGIFASREWGVRVPAMLLVLPFIYLAKLAGPPFSAIDSITLLVFVAGIAISVYRGTLRQPVDSTASPRLSLQSSPLPAD